MDSTVIDSVLISSGTTVAVSSSITDSVVLDLARDYLQTYDSEYAFFQAGGNQLCTPYYLVVGDSVSYDAVQGVFSASSDCDVYCIIAVNTLVVPSPNAFEGTLIGTEEQLLEGEYQPSSYTVTEYVTRTFSVSSFAASNQVLETSARYIVYGSAEGLPHLIDGQQNYLYLVSCLIIGAFAFVLMDRLFQRVI